MKVAIYVRVSTADQNLMNSSQRPPAPPEPKGLILPEPVFLQFPERLKDPGPEIPPERCWCVDLQLRIGLLGSQA